MVLARAEVKGACPVLRRGRYKCQMEQQSLAIYLRNHEAAAQAGRDLFRRTAAGQRNRPYASELAELATEVDQDLESLHAIMRTVRVSPDPCLLYTSPSPRDRS